MPPTTPPVAPTDECPEDTSDLLLRAQDSMDSFDAQLLSTRRFRAFLTKQLETFKALSGQAEKDD